MQANCIECGDFCNPRISAVRVEAFSYICLKCAKRKPQDLQAENELRSYIFQQLADFRCNLHIDGILELPTIWMAYDHFNLLAIGSDVEPKILGFPLQLHGKANMLHIDATLEDTRLIATANAHGIWDVLLNDNLSGKQHKAHCDSEQMAAVLSVAVSSDDGATPEAVRNLVEALFKDAPNECRLIP